MAATEDTDALVIAYVEGELDASAARAFEARLAAEPDLRAEVDGLVAMKEMLQADVRFGRDARVDEPPAHLVNAILQAEALARPAEIRAAAALVRNPTPSLTARMARWLLGGGALVAGAAAMLFVVSRPESDVVALSEVTMASPAPATGSTQRAPTEEPPPPPDVATRADRPDNSIAGGGIGGDAFADKMAAGLEERQRSDGDGAAADAPVALAQPAEAEEPAKEMVEKAEAKSVARSEPKADAAPADGILGFGGAAPKTASAPPPEQKPADDLGALRATASGTTDSMAGPGGAQPKKPAPVVAAPPVASVAEARKELYDRRVADKSKARRSAEASAGKGGSKDGLAKAGESDEASADTKKASKKQAELSPQAMRDAQHADTAFYTGLRELNAKRYVEALNAFQTAETLDHARALGVSPVVGQMRALTALRRSGDVARLGGRLLYADLKGADVVDGLLLGADAAEKVGDALMAEQLWTRLLEVPAHAADARRALARIRRTTRNKAMDLEDAAAAAPEAQPAAAAPPSESR